MSSLLQPAPGASSAPRPIVTRAQWDVIGPHDGAAAPLVSPRMLSGAAGTFALADRVGRALQASFAQILRRSPPRVSKIADVARWLDLDRSVCQRVVLGVRDATDGLGVLERFPGVRGLEQFVAAAQRKGVPAAALKDARRAIEDYALLVSDAGGSQARLVGQIEVLRAEEGSRESTLSAGEFEKYRKKCYEGAVGMTGLASQARVELIIVRPDDSHDIAPGESTDGSASGSRSSPHPARITTVGATGFIGVESSPYAMPLVRKSRQPGLVPVPATQFSGPRPRGGGLTPDMLLKEFTSDPLPRITTRTEGEYLIHVINADGPISRQIDVMTAITFSRPWEAASDPDAEFYSVGRVIGAPTRRLVFDVYLHQQMPAPRSVSAHVIRPGTHGSLGNARPQSRWFDRLPFEHDLVLLSGAPGVRPSPAYARLGELTRHLLAEMNWSGEPFVGYRFEVEYPVFDFEYVIAFDWRAPAGK